MVRIFGTTLPFQHGSVLALLWSACCLFVLIKICLKFVDLIRLRRQTEKDLADFPSPRRHWLYGHLHIIRNLNDETIHFLETEFNAPYSPARLSWTGPFNASLVLNHPSSVKALLTSTEPKDEFFYGFLRPWLGDGLLLSRGSKWFRNRRLLTPGFHFDILKPYVNVFDECADTLVNKWTRMFHTEDSDVITLELFEHVSLMTLDSLLKCIFSQNTHCQTKSQNPYIQGVYSVANILTLRGLFPPYYNDFLFSISPLGYKFKKALKVVHDYSWSVINTRKISLKQEEKENKTNTRKYIDFLDILLKAQDEDGNKLSDQEIKDEVDTFMFEGHDTTASGISWCLFNLANNPKHQQKCRDEINELLAKKGSQDLKWDDLSSLQYITMCIKESMRVNPPVPAIGRTLTSPLTLPDGRTIPAGYRVGAVINSLHHNETVWDDPFEFRPERFTVENSKDRSPYAYLPFAAGPRNCIGQNFAMNEMKVCIAKIIHNFELVVDENRLPKRQFGLVLRSENGIHLKIKPCHPPTTRIK